MRLNTAPRARQSTRSQSRRALLWAATALLALAAAVQAQTHAPPAPLPPPGHVFELDTAIGRAADSISTAADAEDGISVSCGRNGGLLNAYACDMMAAALARVGRQVDRCPAPLDGGAEALPPELPEPLVRYLLNRGAAAIVHVETKLRRGQRQLVVAVYEADTAGLRTSMTVPFRLPEELSPLLSGHSQRLTSDDAKWLMVLEEAFGPAPGNPNGPPPLDRVRADFFFEHGLWGEAARRLENLAASANGRTLMKAAFARQQAGDWEEAGSLVEAALKAAPDSGPLWALRSWLNLRRGRVEDALVYLEEARIWGMAREGIYRFARGLIALEQNDPETAERELIRAAELLADREFAPLELARFYRDRARMDEAIEWYRKATNAADAGSAAWGELAVALETRGDMDGAAEALRNAFRLDSANVAITRHLATVLRRTGRHQEALRVLERAANANPMNPGLLAAWGDCAAEMWQVDTAVEAFEESVAALGEFPYGRVRLAAMLRRQRRYREAREMLTSLIAREPDYYPARIELGRLLMELGRYEEAESALAAATVRPAHEVQARLVLADVHIAAGQPGEAVATSQIAAAAQPDATTYAKLAEAFAAAGDLTKAETSARTAISKGPRLPQANVALGRVLLAREDAEGAQACAEAAIAQDPFWVPALRLGGAAYKAGGDYQRAAEFWRRVVTLDPWNAETHRELSDILGPELDDWTAAEQHLKRYVELEKMRAEASL